MSPPPAPTAAEPKVWVSVAGGAAQLVGVAAARALPADAMGTPQDQAGGWVPLGQLLQRYPMSPASAPAAPRPSFGAPPAAGAPAAQQPQASVPRGVFAGVATAQVARAGAYINPGDYVARVASAEWKEPASAGGFRGVLVELEVVMSSYDAAQHPECNQEGSRMTAFVKHNQSFASNMKEIILAVSGFDEQGNARAEDSVVSDAECEAFVSATQPYAGVLVYLEAREKPTQAQGKFTKVSWWPMPVRTDGSPDHDKLMNKVR